MTSVYPLKDILEWYLHGIWQNVLIWIPLLRPSPEPYNPPQFWHEYWPWDWWRIGLDSGGRPDANWVWRWLVAVKEAWRVKLQDVGDTARDAAALIARNMVGYTQWGHMTFQAWIHMIEARAGRWVPGWAVDIADAASKLWNWLPVGIRNNWQVWDDIWNWLVSVIQAWVYARYDEARTLAYWARDWVNWLINNVVAWYNAAHFWLDALRADPYGMVTGWLGPQWDRLFIFAQDCLDFWYNLWSTGGPILAAFLADPLGWLYDRVEDELVRRW